MGNVEGWIPAGRLLMLAVVVTNVWIDELGDCWAPFVGLQALSVWIHAASYLVVLGVIAFVASRGLAAMTMRSSAVWVVGFVVPALVLSTAFPIYRDPFRAEAFSTVWEVYRLPR